MLVYDVESDGLLDELTVIHCINIIDRKTGERLRFNDTFDDADGSVEDGVRRLQEAEDRCGHGIINFDEKAIAKVYPRYAPKGRIHDTMVHARMLWAHIGEVDSERLKQRRLPPEFSQQRLVGTHKLAAWGYRLGEYKGDYAVIKEAEVRASGVTDEDEITRLVWKTFGRDMDDYCAQDVEVTLKLQELIEGKDWSPDALVLETEVAGIITLQEDHGFLFDAALATKLTAELTIRRAELQDQLRVTFRPWWEPERYKGEHVVFTPKRDDRKHGYVAGCPMTKVKLVTFNPGSRQQIAERMTSLFGWAPVEFTESGQPKVDETTLDGLDYPEAKLLVEYLTVEKRLGQVAEGDNAWLKMVKPDGRIHGRVNPCGAVTGRMTHFYPNIAQVPATHALYGSTCRACFIVPVGFKLVGCDAEGLELRMLAHFMARFDGGAYAKTVVEGKKDDGTDVHTVNMRVVGLRSRDSAKTFIYAYLYGAGNFKLGTIVLDDMTEADRAKFHARYPAGEARDNATARLGLKARRRIEVGLPALGKLQELVKDKAKRKFLRGLDGRRLHVRSQHAALNTLLQGGGAILMKQALVILYRALLAMGFVHGREFAFVANVHDEFQIEVREDLAVTVGELARDAIRLAGEHFKLLCPTAGAFGIGVNWADTH